MRIYRVGWLNKSESASEEIDRIGGAKSISHVLQIENLNILNDILLTIFTPIFTTIFTTILQRYLQRYFSTIYYLEFIDK